MDIPPGEEVIIKGREFAIYAIADEPIAKRPRLESAEPASVLLPLPTEEKQKKKPRKEASTDVVVIDPEETVLGKITKQEEIGRKIWERWLPNCTARNAHPRDERIRFDSSFDTKSARPNERLHDYYIDGLKNPGCSMTGVIKRYWPEFNEDVMAEKVCGAKTGRHKDMTKADVLDLWAKDREFGTRRHAAMEAFLDRDAVAIEWNYVPFGFLKFLLEHPTFVPYRVEWSLFHYTRSGYIIYGQVDAVFLDTATGNLVVVDWKNTRGFMKKAWFNECGIHPRTWRTPATKPNKYAYQVQGYATMIELEYRLPHTISHTLILNFDPEVRAAAKKLSDCVH